MTKHQGPSTNIQRSTKDQAPINPVVAPGMRVAVDESREIRARGYRLRQRKDGKYWLSSGRGEGMECSEGEIGEMLERFMQERF